MSAPIDQAPEVAIPQDVRVLIALYDVPLSAPLEVIAACAAVTMPELRESMMRLATREPDGDA